MRTRLLPLLVPLFAVLVTRGSSQSATPSAPATAAAGQAAAPAEASSPAEPAVTIKSVEPAHPTVTKTKGSSGEDTLSVDFPDTDIRDILRNVADLFELNLVIPETLQGKASIKLRDVTWRQIFEAVLQPVGYTYIEEGNIIKIVSSDTLLQEPVTTEVFVVNYARAADLVPTISSLVDPAKGKIVVDARTNSLVITERPSRMNRIRPIIEKLDKATDQVMIESKFVEVTTSDIKNLGVNWASLQGFHVNAGPLNGSYTRTQNGTVTNGTDSNNGTTNTSSNGTTSSTTNGSTSGTNNSTSGTQSNTGTTTTTVSSTNGLVTPTSTTTTGTTLGSTTTTGTSGSTTTGSTSGTTGSTDNAISNTLNLLNSISGSLANDRTLSAVFSSDQFSVVLSALQSLNSTKIVSNPTIVTLNNTEATINVGESDPIPRYQFNQQTGSYEVAGFDYKDIGINLKVTPSVNARGFIKMAITPEVSQKNGVATFGPAEIPIIGTRKATTQVSLKDGYTMGIGGLLTSNAQNGNTKVPLLGSIPLLGRFFRSDSKNIQTTNLLIFITAKSIQADGGSIDQIFDPRRIREMGIKKEDLPGYRDGSDAFEAPKPTTDATDAKKKHRWFSSN